MQQNSPSISVRVFISYAHADRELRRKLENHLSALKHAGKIIIWQDQEIPPGANWKDQICTHLNGADLILLLLSADFMASEYCWSQEVKVALERHETGKARVVPVIVRPVHWQVTPLGHLQALPTEAKPVTRWKDIDDALEDVALGLHPLVDQLLIPLQDPTHWLDVGHEHYDARHYTEALVAYEQVMRLDANLAFAYRGKGNALRYLKRHGEALSAYEQAIRLDPRDALAHYGKGATLSDLKRHEEALKSLEEAIRLKPDFIHSYNSKGNVLRDLKRYDEASAAYEQAIDRDPGHAKAYHNKGYALYKLKRYEEALSAYEQAIHLDPGHALAHYGKGHAFYKLERYEEALSAYEQAIHLGPGDALAHYGKGNALKRLGRQTEAEQAYAKARQLHGD